MMQMYELIRIYYLNILWKCCKKVCNYNITLKRIDTIIKEAKCNFIKQNY